MPKDKQVEPKLVKKSSNNDDIDSEQTTPKQKVTKTKELSNDLEQDQVAPKRKSVKTKELSNDNNVPEQTPKQKATKTKELSNDDADPKEKVTKVNKKLSNDDGSKPKADKKSSNDNPDQDKVASKSKTDKKSSNDNPDQDKVASKSKTDKKSSNDNDPDLDKPISRMKAFKAKKLSEDREANFNQVEPKRRPIKIKELSDDEPDFNQVAPKRRPIKIKELSDDEPDFIPVEPKRRPIKELSDDEPDFIPIEPKRRPIKTKGSPNDDIDFDKPEQKYKFSDAELAKKFPNDESEQTEETGVIYAIVNRNDGKAYIGRCFSHEKHGKHPMTVYGANGRFRRHLSNALGADVITRTECPIFYEEIRNHNGDKNIWYVTTLKVISKKHLKEYETKFIKRYNTSDPKFGYNYFVGDNKPDDSTYLSQYQEAKAASNASRVQDGSLKKLPQNIGLPANIHYKETIFSNGIPLIGYFVQIKIDGKIYYRAFLSKDYSLEQKLEMAKDQLEKFKKKAQDLRDAKAKMLLEKQRESPANALQI
jgi:hypothetical protein